MTLTNYNHRQTSRRVDIEPSRSMPISIDRALFLTDMSAGKLSELEEKRNRIPWASGPFPPTFLPLHVYVTRTAHTWKLKPFHFLQ